MLSEFGFYLYVFLNPISFTIFVWKYIGAYYNDTPIACKLLRLFLFAFPFFHVVWQVISLGNNGTWLSQMPDDFESKKWWTPPKGKVATVFQKACLETSVMVSLFMLHSHCNNYDEIIRNNIKDEACTKKYWREQIQRGGLHTAKEVGCWDGRKLTMNMSIDGMDLVLKVDDSYLGIGDQFLEFGKHFNSVEDLEKMLNESKYSGLDFGSENNSYSYHGQTVHLLEWCRPDKKLGVHSFDILTVKLPHGVEVATCILWAECTGSSSHSATAGYLVDINTETIAAPCKWYAPCFADTTDKMVGMKVPGIAMACKAVAKIHETKPVEWMGPVGWDSMIMKNGELTFFEGNFGVMRMPRRIFLSFKSFIYFALHLSWPTRSYFKKKGIVSRQQK